MIKSLAVIACVAGATLVAGGGASACGNGAKEVLASPVSIQLEASVPQPAPKDQWTAQQEAKEIGCSNR